VFVLLLVAVLVLVFVLLLVFVVVAVEVDVEVDVISVSAVDPSQYWVPAVQVPVACANTGLDNIGVIKSIAKRYKRFIVNSL
jgi:hypothetical protein